MVRDQRLMASADLILAQRERGDTKYRSMLANTTTTMNTNGNNSLLTSATTSSSASARKASNNNSLSLSSSSFVAPRAATNFDGGFEVPRYDLEYVDKVPMTRHTSGHFHTGPSNKDFGPLPPLLGEYTRPITSPQVHSNKGIEKAWKAGTKRQDVFGRYPYESSPYVDKFKTTPAATHSKKQIQTQTSKSTKLFSEYEYMSEPFQQPKQSFKPSPALPKARRASFDMGSVYKPVDTNNNNNSKHDNDSTRLKSKLNNTTATTTPAWINSQGRSTNNYKSTFSAYPEYMSDPHQENPVRSVVEERTVTRLCSKGQIPMTFGGATHNHTTKPTKPVMATWGKSFNNNFKSSSSSS